MEASSTREEVTSFVLSFSLDFGPRYTLLRIKLQFRLSLFKKDVIKQAPLDFITMFLLR